MQPAVVQGVTTCAPNPSPPLGQPHYLATTSPFQPTPYPLTHNCPTQQNRPQPLAVFQTEPSSPP